QPAVVIALAVAALGLAAFVVAELRADDPLLDVRYFRRRGFTTGALSVTLQFLTTFGFFLLIVQYLQMVKGYGAIGASMALAPMIVPVMVMSLLSPRFTPKLGLKVVTVAGLSALALGMIVLSGLDADSTYWDLLWPLLIASVGLGMSTAPATSAIVSDIPADEQGVAAAVNDAMREVGAAIGIAIAGSILAARYADGIAPVLPAVPEAGREAVEGSWAGPGAGGGGRRRGRAVRRTRAGLPAVRGSGHAVRVRVEREPFAAAEGRQCHAGVGGQPHRQRGRRADRRQDGDAGHRRLLDQLEGGATGDLQHRVPQGEPALAQCPAHHLVDGVVAAHVLADTEQFSRGGEQARRVDAAGPAEQGLVLEEPLRQGQQCRGGQQRLGGRGGEVRGPTDLVDRVDATDAAGAGHGGGPRRGGMRDVGGQGDGQRVVVLLAPAAREGAVADLRQVLALPDRALGDQVAGGQIPVVP